jgi:serine/threonine-protein kinase
MTEPTDSPTLLIPADRGGHQLRKEKLGSVAERATTALPTDILNQSAARLRVLALLYAFTFFMAAFFPAFVFPAGRQNLFARPINWVPGTASIAVALSVAWMIRSARLTPRSTIVVALAFEIAGSYGIAAAEFLQPLDVRGPWVGLSWVAAWVLLFNVVVPTLPRHAVLAALASVTAVPVMVLTSVQRFRPFAVSVGPVEMFFAFVFPYLLIVIMAYIGAQVVYSLGREVSRARELGSYRLVERLGAGGMGEVWKADHRLLARPAAIKLIQGSPSGELPGMVSDDMRRRFEREAQVTARLRSPHTVTLFDFGISDNGAFYYVMELLDGLDADRLVRRFGPLSAERVVSILEQMCHSLSEAHSYGLVHRDIKPANIFLCRYGEDDDFVKVLDFGIAKADGRSASEPELTVANVIQGTPAFIAPEQAMGGADVDARADIYATGCVAFWLLTGELLFKAETPMKILMAHANEVPDAPSSRTELPIPAGLDALVLSCLAKDRERRPQSARALLEGLQQIKLETSWTAERAREWWKRNVPEAGI